MCVLRSSGAVVDSLPYLLLKLRRRRLVRRSENEAAISSILFDYSAWILCVYIYTHDGGKSMTPSSYIADAHTNSPTNNNHKVISSLCQEKRAKNVPKT
jgi:hypothetical protein